MKNHKPMETTNMTDLLHFSTGKTCRMFPDKLGTTWNLAIRLVSTAVPGMLRKTRLAALAIAFAPYAVSHAGYWSDNFNVKSDTWNINADNATRQGGAAEPFQYLTNSPNSSNDYHHQMFAPSSPLQLAGDPWIGAWNPDPALSTAGLALVSPGHDFSASGAGTSPATRITCDLFVGAVVGGNTDSYTWAAVTCGSGTPLSGSGTSAAGFSVRFVEDRFSDINNPVRFIQFLDGSNVVMAFAANPAAGKDWIKLEIRVEDETDGNPWNGSGDATIYVSVNGIPIAAPYTKVGGYSKNFITLEGAANTNGFGQATHYFDNLAVFSLPLQTLSRWTWSDMPHYSLSKTRTDVRYFQAPQESVQQPGSLSGELTRFTAGRIRGYVTPQETGWYRFWISSGESAELWLSSQSGDKYRKQYLCGLSGELGSGNGFPADHPFLWDIFAFQMSREVYLEAGMPYYIESDYQFGHSGNAHVSIAWALRGGERHPIPQAALTPYSPTVEDSEDDFLPDAWEIQYGLNIGDAGGFDNAREGEFGDFDGDGLTNREEYVLNTNPASTDTDGDGESDNDEVNALGTNALVADSINDTLLGEIDLGSFVSSSTNWITTSGGLLSDSFRGDVTWNFNVPSAGNWLLRLSAELMGTTYGNETVPVIVKVDGKTVSRRAIHFGSGKFAILQALTPFLTAGNHQVSILVDNMFARRTVRLVSLKILAPANATALLARDNRVTAHPESSRTSPAFLEGYARDEESVTVNGVVASEGMGDGHWFANIPLAAQDGPQAHSIQFESGYGLTGSFTWQPTNALDAETLVIRQGDSLRIGAWNGDPAMKAFLSSTMGPAWGHTAGLANAPTLPVQAGGVWHLTGNQAIAVPFPSAGTFTFTGRLANGSTGVLTVRVVAPPGLPGDEIDVLDAVPRTINCTVASGVFFETRAEICHLQVWPLPGGATDLRMLTLAPRGFGIAARLSSGGPILALQRVNVIGVSDALQNDMTMPGVTGIIGYKLYNSPLTVTNFPDGARIDVTIYRAGVMFPNGGTQRSIYPADLSNGWVNLQFLFPIGVSGGYCHSVAVFGRSGEYLGTR